nr:GTPase domain-containing protein [uncultured Campylobacter sp.]
MVIGKTGVGKSSLFNYLCGQNIAKVGTGEAVTRKGEFQHTIVPMSGNLDYHIYDSWGLEANKAEEWKKLIEDKLENPLTEETKTKILWFTFTTKVLNTTGTSIHAVLYCISCNSRRIEPFEIDMMRYVLESQFKLIIVFTQADANGAKEAADGISKEINEKLAKFSGKYEFVGVSSPQLDSGDEMLIKKASSSPFGKEKLEELIFKDVWYNILYRTLDVWEKSEIQSVKNLRSYHNRMIEDFSVNGDFTDNIRPRAAIARDISERIQSDFQSRVSDIQSNLKKAIEQIREYYKAICKEALANSPQSNISVSFVDSKYGSNADVFAVTAASLVMTCIPVVNVIFKLFVEKDAMRDDLKKERDKIEDSIIKMIKDSRRSMFEKFSN